jgi:phage protein D/phage baseplate assembly protein gpV
VSQQQPRVAFKVKIGGREIAADAQDRVSKVIVEDEVSLPDMAIVLFDDPTMSVTDQIGARLGTELEIVVQTSEKAEGEAIFKGEVTALEVEVDNERKRSVVRAYDRSHRLQRGRVSQTFLDMSIGDVLAQVAGRHGLSSDSPDGMSWTNESLVQWNETDWELLSALAAEHGRELVIDEDKLALRRPASAGDAPGPAEQDTAVSRQLVAGRNLLRVRAVMTAGEQVATVEVRGWDPAQKQAVVGTASAAKAPTHGTATDPNAIAGEFGGSTLVRADLPLDNAEPANSTATAIVEQRGGIAAEIEGITYGDPQLRAGQRVTITGIGTQFDGDHTLTSCRHVLGPEAGYTTEFRSSGTQRRGLLGLAAGGGGTRREVPGVLPAVVSSIDDPDDLGRVKVTYPWLSDGAVSPWARVATPGAGPDRGLVCLPEVNDEVLVAFHHGDPRLPYVIGGLHNGVDRMPPDLRTGEEVDKRVMVSRNKHRLDLDDKNNRVLLSLGSDDLQLDMAGADTKITMTSSGEILIKSTSNLSLQTDGDLALEAKGKVSIKGMGVEIDAGGGAFEATGTQSKLVGQASFEISAAQVKVAGSAMTEITGALVKIN